MSNCDFFDEYSSEHVLFLIQNIENISIENLNRLPNSLLEKIFSSPDLQIVNEDFLFDRICQLIHIDKNKKYLLKTVKFPYVSSHLLKDFFGNFSVYDLDEDLFEPLKNRIFCDIFSPSSPPALTRWKEKPILLSLKEISNENQKLKKENELLKNSLRLNSIRIDIADHFGIISDFKKNDSSSVVIKASDTNSGRSVQDLLTFDDSSWWSNDHFLIPVLHFSF
jgi:hypothetical protein